MGGGGCAGDTAGNSFSCEAAAAAGPRLQTRAVPSGLRQGGRGLFWDGTSSPPPPQHQRGLSLAGEDGWETTSGGLLVLIQSRFRLRLGLTYPKPKPKPRVAFGESKI